jgi:hypothetical protein
MALGEREKVKACIETRLFCKLFMEKIESYHLSTNPLFFSGHLSQIFLNILMG